MCACKHAGYKVNILKILNNMVQKSGEATILLYLKLYLYNQLEIFFNKMIAVFGRILCLSEGYIWL